MAYDAGKSRAYSLRESYNSDHAIAGRWGACRTAVSLGPPVTSPR
jgi:hypothetical protein